MGTLTEQIRQMIDVLELVDPEAAREFRTGPQNRVFSPALQAPVTSVAPQVVTMSPSIPQRDVEDTLRPGTDTARRRSAVPNPKTAVRTSLSQLREPVINPLQINPMTDNLIRSVIYSEILGVPVSRRRRQGRRQSF